MWPCGPRTEGDDVLVLPDVMEDGGLEGNRNVVFFRKNYSFAS